jgi:hypothetical protein
MERPLGAGGRGGAAGTWIEALHGVLVIGRSAQDHLAIQLIRQGESSMDVIVALVLGVVGLMSVQVGACKGTDYHCI